MDILQAGNHMTLFFSAIEFLLYGRYSHWPRERGTNPGMSA